MLRYVQSQNGVFLRHVHDVEPTQWDEDTFCFARKLTPEQALYFGVAKLRIATPPYYDPATQQRDEGPAILEDGVWTQQYVVTEMDSEEALAKIADQAHRVREERDRLLASCDWTQAADVPVDRTAWAAYRQLLRELPLQEGFPWSITWPDAP